MLTNQLGGYSVRAVELRGRYFDAKQKGGHRRNKGDTGGTRVGDTGGTRGGHRRNTKSINKPINFAFVAKTAQN